MSKLSARAHGGLLLTAAVVWLADVGLARDTGLCAPNETIYFSCSTKRAKIVSLCGQPDGVVQYRFGKPGTIEMRYPTKVEAGETLRYAHYSRYQTDYVEITFTVDGYRYVVADYSESSRRQIGVSVAGPSGKNILDLPCKGAAQNRLPDLEEKLPCDEDNALAYCPEKPHAGAKAAP